MLKVTEEPPLFSPSQRSDPEALTALALRCEHWEPEADGVALDWAEAEADGVALAWAEAEAAGVAEWAGQYWVSSLEARVLASASILVTVV